MEGAHHRLGLFKAKGLAPQAENLHELIDKVFARLAGECHHGHRAQFKAQVLGEQQDTQHQRSGFARPRTSDHRSGRRIAENHLPLRGARLGMGWQQTRYISLHAFLQFGGQRQAPIIEQAVVNTGRTVLIGTKVANQQDLPAFFDAISLAFAIAILDTCLVPAAKAIRLPMQPGKPVLGAQTRQPMAKQARGEALEQGHVCQWAQFWGQIRGVLRHADSSDEVGFGECVMVAGIALQFQPIALSSCS